MKQQICNVIAKVVLLASLALAWAAAANAQQFSAWSAPVNLNNLTDSNGNPCPAVNSTSPDVNDTHPATSMDGLSLYFASTRPGGSGSSVNYDLWVTHRESPDSCWQTPTNLGGVVNTSANEQAPNLSADGHWLFFHSKRSVGCNGGVVAELWASHRQRTSDDLIGDLAWEPPINLGCAINGKDPTSGSFTDINAPDLFVDKSGNLYLYFTRNMFPGDLQGDHLYVSTCSLDLDTCNTQGLWGQGKQVALNSQYRSTRPAIRQRDGLEMILVSPRPGSAFLSENLWVSTRPTVTPGQENWAQPEPINCDGKTGFIRDPVTGTVVPCSPWNSQGPPINSNAVDGSPALSWDGTELYFTRSRPDLSNFVRCTEGTDQETTDGVPLCRDLYVSKRTYITKTVLNSSANPSVVGQSVTFTATVSSANDSPPTGTAKFSDESNDLGTSALASGQATFTTSSLSVGAHSITGQYGGDRISSASSGSLTQNVEYAICPLYDQTRSVKSGATFPIRLQLCDANGSDLSSSAIVVHATSVTAVSGYSGTPDAPGNANPDNDFRFDATLGSTGGYIFNLSTGGLSSGTYSLQFTAGSDPVTHSVNFGVN